jgi:hypothetical protein
MVCLAAIGCLGLPFMAKAAPTLAFLAVLAGGISVFTLLFLNEGFINGVVLKRKHSPGTRYFQSAVIVVACGLIALCFIQDARLDRAGVGLYLQTEALGHGLVTLLIPGREIAVRGAIGSMLAGLVLGAATGTLIGCHLMNRRLVGMVVALVIAGAGLGVLHLGPGLDHVPTGEDGKRHGSASAESSVTVELGPLSCQQLDGGSWHDVEDTLQALPEPSPYLVATRCTVSALASSTTHARIQILATADSATLGESAFIDTTLRIDEPHSIWINVPTTLPQGEAIEVGCVVTDRQERLLGSVDRTFHLQRRSN